MQGKVIRADELSVQQTNDWRRIQRENRDLGSPFFHPGYTTAVGAVRNDVRVLCIERDGEAIGFFPFQDESGVGRPVGLRLSDFQGIVAPEGVELDAEALLHSAGLKVWHFDHLLTTQPSLSKFHLAHKVSPFMDVSAGYEAYAKARQKSGSKFLSQLSRKSRKISREVGPLRFEFHATDPSVLKTLLHWKSEQRKRTGTVNVLDFDWVRELLERLVGSPSTEFSGVLSSLYAGDELLAVHLGMRSESVLHYWFPAYDSRFSKYSPGGILLMELAKACAADGIERVDLGTGKDAYKDSFASDRLELAEGCLDSRLMSRLLWKAWYRGRAWSQSSRIHEIVKPSVKAARHYALRRSLR